MGDNYVPDGSIGAGSLHDGQRCASRGRGATANVLHHDARRGQQHLALQLDGWHASTRGSIVAQSLTGGGVPAAEQRPVLRSSAAQGLAGTARVPVAQGLAGTAWVPVAQGPVGTARREPRLTRR